MTAIYTANRYINSQVTGNLLAIANRGANRLRTGTQSDEEASAGILWQPISRPQRDALETKADELFYGGAAGGGKSDLLLGAAFTQHCRAIIFRREASQLTAMVDRSREIANGLGRFNSTTLIWRGIPGVKMIRFAGVKDLGNEKRFQGQARDLSAFDELPEFLEQQYLFLIGWNRHESALQRVRSMAAGNPPTSSEGEWVISRWSPWLDEQHANPAVPGELRWFIRVDDKDTEVEDATPITHKGEIITPKSRTFIPASVDDNPFYVNSGYKAQLQLLPEPLRSQMLYGNFQAGRTDNVWQVIPTHWVRLAQKRYLLRVHEAREEITSAGGDVARGGRDASVIATVHGGDFVELVSRRGEETPDGQAYLKFLQETLGMSADYDINIDVIGIGASAYDFAKNFYGGSARGINFSSGSKQRDKTRKFRLYNIRAVAYWKLRELLDPESGADICLPPDSGLLSDLVTPLYEIRSGAIIIESKDEIIKRIGRSPDKGDAVALALLSLGNAVALPSTSQGLPEGVMRSHQQQAMNERPSEVPVDTQGRFVPPNSAAARMQRRRY